MANGHGGGFSTTFEPFEATFNDADFGASFAPAGAAALFDSTPFGEAEAAKAVARAAAEAAETEAAEAAFAELRAVCDESQASQAQLLVCCAAYRAELDSLEGEVRREGA
eukprot:1964170-Prymnesium_polylepis.1